MRASDKAYGELRRDIVEWRLPPGTVLGEVEQAERLGVSRTPLREALSRLTADGLAVQQRGRGAVVSDVSLEHVDDLFALRRALEVESARIAARSGATDPFIALSRRFAAAATPSGEKTVDAPRENYYRLASELDAAIDDAVRNPYLEQALRGLRVHLARVRRLAQDDPARLRASAGEHAAIARSIAAGDPDLAAAATMLHLQHSLDHIKSHAPTREDPQ
ncbi:GntR family transcriptional regulator [Arthrobacter sp. KK5.5]|uniref:GntR family transcriptional regulator n=1 Tax=Arthrobacter sp. KK5.5 TaxID=3373084 RepID=UPI003EE7AC22